ERRRFADQLGEGHAATDRRLFAVELGPTEDPLELQNDSLDATVGNEQVVPPAEDEHRQVLLLRERQGVAHVVQTLRPEEELRRASDPQGRVEAEKLLESDGTGDSAKHPVPPFFGVVTRPKNGMHGWCQTAASKFINVIGILTPTVNGW